MCWRTSGDRDLYFDAVRCRSALTSVGKSLTRRTGRGPSESTFSIGEPAPKGLLPVLGEKVAKPDEGAFSQPIALENPSPYPLPEYRERAAFISFLKTKARAKWPSPAHSWEKFCRLGRDPAFRLNWLGRGETTELYRNADSGHYPTK
jgi:hypothetical protein